MTSFINQHQNNTKPSFSNAANTSKSNCGSSHQVTGLSNTSFGSALSTGGVKAQAGEVQSKIGNAMKSDIQNIKSQLQGILKSLDNLMQSMEKQSSGKGACGAAAQMTSHMDNLSEVTKNTNDNAGSLNSEARDILNQISTLLSKLTGSMHTDLSAHQKFKSK